LIEGATVRIVRREVEQIARQVRRNLETRDAREFRDWLVGFYERQRGHVSQTMLPLFQSFAEQIAEAAAGEIGGDAVDLDRFTREYVAGLSARYSGGHEGQLVQLLEDTPHDEIADAIRTRLVEWKERTHRARSRTAKACRPVRRLRSPLGPRPVLA
jgi:hypothetical protein